MHNTRLALVLPPPPLNLISQECGLTAALELRSNETPLRDTGLKLLEIHRCLGNGRAAAGVGREARR